MKFSEALKHMKDLRRRLRTSAKLAKPWSPKKELRERDAKALDVLIQGDLVPAPGIDRLDRIALILENIHRANLVKDAPFGWVIMCIRPDQIEEIYRLAKNTEPL